MRTYNSTKDKGPHFFLVHERPWHAGSTEPIGVRTWESLAFWNVSDANRRAAEIKANGYLAFVEMK